MINKLYIWINIFILKYEESSMILYSQGVNVCGNNIAVYYVHYYVVHWENLCISWVFKVKK